MAASAPERAHTPDGAAALQAGQVSAFPVQGPEEERADVHLRARSAFVALDDPEVGTVRHVRNSRRFDEVHLTPSGPAPPLGAHTEEVLVQLLGPTPAEARQLAADGVCW